MRGVCLTGGLGVMSAWPAIICREDAAKEVSYDG